MKCTTQFVVIGDNRFQWHIYILIQRVLIFERVLSSYFKSQLHSRAMQNSRRISIRDIFYIPEEHLFRISVTHTRFNHSRGQCRPFFFFFFPRSSSYCLINCNLPCIVLLFQQAYLVQLDGDLPCNRPIFSTTVLGIRSSFYLFPFSNVWPANGRPKHRMS